MTSKKDVKTLIAAEDIAKRVASLAQEIANNMTPDIMIIALLRGSFVFTADLIRALHFAGVRPQVEFMTLSSYGSGIESSGKVQITRDINEDVRGREVLIVDDILESGNTLTFARNLIKERGAASTKIAVMLEKPNKRKVAIDADFVGFTIPDKFVVGYGLDYANYYRELPFIGVIEI
ncbi:MAG: hypoxanthine phosphoribosyltransferase [Rickettsiales bacterium]